MPIPIIEIDSPRLRLIGTNPAFIHDCFNTLTETELQNVFGTEDLTQLREMHQKGMESFRISHFLFLIHLKSKNCVIGQIGFHTWNYVHHRAELFYHLYKEEDKNKGYMKEALPIVIKYGFEGLNLHRIQAMVAKDNIPSVKLIEHNGFVFESTAREDYWVEDHFEDSECYSLLKSEWEVKR
jgi:[ribosomal protein S5]-alanine N-acetyltransferase